MPFPESFRYLECLCDQVSTLPTDLTNLVVAHGGCPFLLGGGGRGWVGFLGLSLAAPLNTIQQTKKNPVSLRAMEQKSRDFAEPSK